MSNLLHRAAVALACAVGALLLLAVIAALTIILGAAGPADAQVDTPTDTAVPTNTETPTDTPTATSTATPTNTLPPAGTARVLVHVSRDHIIPVSRQRLSDFSRQRLVPVEQ